MSVLSAENNKASNYFTSKMEQKELQLRTYSHGAPATKSRQSCPTLGNPIDVSPPGSPIPGILQARALEWVAISFPNAWKWKVKVKSLSRVQLLATPWTAAYQAPPSMGFSRQEYRMGCHCLLRNHGEPHTNSSKSDKIKGRKLSERRKGSWVGVL